MTLLLILSSFLVVISVIATPVEVRDDTDDVASDRYRLPQLYQINNYILDLIVPEEIFTEDGDEYNGTVTIVFSFTNETEEISLHSNPDHIAIKGINFNSSDVDTDSYSVDEETDILKITLPSPVNVGQEYSLIIDFTGRISQRDPYGFYKSRYVDQDGVTQYLATTQFQTTHARKAFPCFDEPSFKAKFDVSITYPTNLTALFNTPEQDSSRNEITGLTTTTFEQTPIMSTYLIAFVISQFTCTSGEDVDGVAFQVCSRDEVEDTRARAVEIGSKVIDRLNAYTGYNYNKTIRKMDQVAIPDAIGAMENWGLVTYRESALLWDENESSNKYNQLITTVIAHEFAHQWFGDLVTCNWWSETFLNEGFATYFEYYITSEVTSDWELDKQFLVEQVHTALVADALENGQALQSDVSSPSEIESKFGTISYNKGGSIARMVAHFLGFEDFRAGLQKYLSDNEFSTTVPEDLWAALGNSSNVTLPADTLGEVMENWVTKPGFPVVTARLEDDNVVISQERFLLSATDTETKWYVPITYTTSEDEDKFDDTSVAVWLTPEDDVTIPYSENISWIILNNQQTGYYRVNYEDTLWNKIKAALDSEAFGGIVDLNRAQIVDDLFNLARAGKVKYSLVLNIANYLSEDTSYYPWYAAFTGFDFLLRRVRQSNLETVISSSILDLLENLYESVPFSNVNSDDQVYTLKQVLTLTWACRLGNEECVKEVSDQFQTYKDSGVRPNRNLRTVVYCNALRYSSDKSDWEFLWDAFLNASNLATEQITILNALGCTRDTDLLKEYLTKTIADDSPIRSQYATSVFSSIYSSNSEGVAVAYDFLIENYEKIAERYSSLNSVGNILRGIAERFTTEAEINKLKDLINSDNLPESFLTAAEAALEIANANIQWTQQFEEDLRSFYGLNGVNRIGASFVVTVIAVLINKLFIH